MKFSIIVPVYNVEAYLEKCLDSLVNQTYNKLEIICVNDGSTDNSLEILNRYALNDNRIIVINQQNNGVSVARNTGIKNATGEYITFVDADDWLELNACEIMYQSVQENDSDVFLFSHFNIFGSKKKSFDMDKICKSGMYLFDNIDEYIKNIIYVPAMACAKLYKKEFLLSNRIEYKSGIRTHEDVLFWFDVLHNKPQLLVKNIPLYNYVNIRAGSATNDIDMNILDYNIALETILQSSLYINANSISQMYIYDKLMSYYTWMWIKHRSYRNYLVTDIKKFLLGYKNFDYAKTKNLKNYNLMKKHLRNYKYRYLNNVLKQIFSIKNDENHKFKIITLMGIIFKISLKKHRL